MPSQLSILVFIASPLDFARYRHAALYFDFENAHTLAQIEDKLNDSNTENRDDIKSAVMEVVGSTGYYSFHERVNMPIAVTGLAKAVSVSSIPDTVSVSSLRATISGTPVVNKDGDWNSQNWVGDALGRLVRAGYLESGVRDQALDDMVDVILEAKDEEV